ncbi:MAG: AAA family ATPase [Bacteroidota bacterium]|nr:AAA family ATPase [Bacteroidota bacterium]
MKILSVTLHNIASIEGPFKIDFEAEPLKNTGIFAIVGQTGSGKSTILDAICLALYNTTPRLKTGNSKVLVDSGVDELATNNVRNLLRKGAVSGYVKVVFLAVDGNRYESHWAIKRASNKINGKIQEESIVLKEFETDSIYSEHRKSQVLLKIRDLIGLSFEEFTKTVILSQGDFASFLKQKDEERSDILEKLTGTEIYTQISKIVFQKNKQHKEAIDFLEKQIQAVALLSEESKEEYTTTINRLNQQEQQFYSEIEQSKKQLQWFTDFNNIQNQIDNAQQALNEVLEQQKNSNSEYENLMLIEHFQTIKPYFEQNVGTEKKLNELAILKQENNDKTDRLKQTKSELEQKINNQNDLLERKKIVFENQKELLEKVKNIDYQLVEKKRFLDKRKSDYQEKEKNYTNIQAEIDTCSTRIEKGQQEYLQPRIVWKNNNEDARIVAENRMWLEQTMTTLSKVVTERYDLENQNDSLQNQKEILEEQLAQERKLLEEKQQLLDEDSKKLKSIDELFNQIDLVSINEQNATLNLDIEKYNSQKQLVSNINRTTEQLEGARLKIKESIGNQTNVKTELSNTIALKDKKTIELEALKKVFLKLQLTESEQVELLRNQLHQGEACPVCGAVEHPYLLQKRDAVIMTSIEEEVNALSEQVNQLNERIIQLQSEEAFLEREIVTLQQTVQELSKTLESNGLELLEEYKGQQYDVAIEQIDTILKEASEQIVVNNKKLQEFSKIRNRKHLLEQNQQKLFGEVENLKKTLQTNQDNLKSLESNQKEFEIRLENIRKSEIENQQRILKLNFSESFFGELCNGIQGGKEVIEEKCKQWNEVVSQIEKAEKQIQKIQEDKISLIAQSTTMKEDLERYKLIISNESQEVQALQKLRFELFEDNNPSEVEHEYHQFVEQQSQNLKQSNEELVKVKMDLQSLESQINNIERSISENQVINKELTLQLNQWLEQHHLHHTASIREQLTKWLDIPNSWIVSQKQRFQELKDNILKMQTILKEKQTLLQNHQKDRPSDVDYEQLSENIVSLNNTFTQVKEEKMKLQSILSLNQEKYKMVSDLQTEVNDKKEKAQQWFVLNDLIGSEKGYKFRKFAQQYTLDVLLSYANYHLKYINKRYKLARIPDSLNLQVFDNDMGGEVRSVYSLSGGETFLVSLALALALSSISSSRMNVETLFIDEGFGSLDAQTLTIALDALENLQNQGKKIGVISHVQEMAERIPVKICVTKEGNGKSSIAVN